MRHSAIGATFGALLIATSVQASTFDIVFDIPDEATDEQRQLLGASEFFWESIITGYQDGVEIDQVDIAINAFEIDGVGGTLAFGGVLDVVDQGGFILPSNSFIDFDFADLAVLEDAGTIFDTLNHEVAHALGFGTVWEENGVYIDGSGEYTGENGLATYQAEFDPNAAFVPVELEFGDGTADAHWDEEWAGGVNALLTGFADPPEMLTLTTLASFNDIGYQTVTFDAPAPIPLPAAIWMMLAAFGPLGLLARRRRRLAA